MLRKHQQRSAKRCKRFKSCNQDEVEEQHKLFDLSDDANTVIRLMFDVIGDQKKITKASRTGLRMKLKVAIIERLNWSATRVKESFEEIQEALS